MTTPDPALKGMTVGHALFCCVPSMLFVQEVKVLYAS